MIDETPDLAGMLKKATLCLVVVLMKPMAMNASSSEC